jgi:hypothetical protein
VGKGLAKRRALILTEVVTLLRTGSSNFALTPDTRVASKSRRRAGPEGAEGH